MNPNLGNDREWRRLLKRLPGARALDASAKAFGALQRRRAVKTGEQLLRLALGYSMGGLSLREGSAWAEVTGVASLSNVALMKRVKGASNWLGHLVGQLLARQSGVKSKGNGRCRRLRLVDGTTLQQPGSTGIDWRLHVTYDLEGQRLVGAELTDRAGAEKLERVSAGPGEIVMADRCYARPDGLRHTIQSGADYVVRLGAGSLRLLGRDGKPFDMLAFLRGCDARGYGDTSVLIDRARGRRSWQLQGARVVAVRKPAAAAAQSRREAARVSRKNGHKIKKQTLISAEYVILLTSLDRKLYTSKEVAALYRLRWQVEIAIKRLKSILCIDRLPIKDPELARSWLFAHLLTALPIDEMRQEFLAAPPWAQGRSQTETFDLAADQDVPTRRARRDPRTDSHRPTLSSRKQPALSPLRATA
jgi:hypothetical protein